VLLWVPSARYFYEYFGLKIYGLYNSGGVIWQASGVADVTHIKWMGIEKIIVTVII